MNIHKVFIKDDGEILVYVDEVPMFYSLQFGTDKPYYWAELDGFVAHFYCEKTNGPADIRIEIPTRDGLLHLVNPYPSRPSVFNKQGYPHSVACTYIEHSGNSVRGAITLALLETVEAETNIEGEYSIRYRGFHTQTDLMYVPSISKLLVPSFLPPGDNPRLSHWDKNYDTVGESSWAQLREQKAITMSERL